jgi:hypothetical protein
MGVAANPHAYDFYCNVGFADVSDVETRFGAGSRMKLPIADEDA